MTQALLLVGSPRGKKSTSTSVGSYLLNILQEKGLEVNTLWINRQLSSEEKISQMLEAIYNTDIIILTAPLYDDCQPYIVTKTMEIIATQQKSLENRRFIPIVNCGFPESHHITVVAIPIYKKFASTVGFEWAGSLAFGGVSMLQGDTGKQLNDLGRTANKVRKVLDQIADALVIGNSFPDKAVDVLPGIIYRWPIINFITRMNNRYWESRAEQNDGAVDTRPYFQ